MSSELAAAGDGAGAGAGVDASEVEAAASGDAAGFSVFGDAAGTVPAAGVSNAVVLKLAVRKWTPSAAAAPGTTTPYMLAALFLRDPAAEAEPLPVDAAEFARERPSATTDAECSCSGCAQVAHTLLTIAPGTNDTQPTCLGDERGKAAAPPPTLLGEAPTVRPDADGTGTDSVCEGAAARNAAAGEDAGAIVEAEAAAGNAEGALNTGVVAGCFAAGDGAGAENIDDAALRSGVEAAAEAGLEAGAAAAAPA